MRSNSYFENLPLQFILLSIRVFLVLDYGKFRPKCVAINISNNNKNFICDWRLYSNIIYLLSQCGVQNKGNFQINFSVLTRNISLVTVERWRTIEGSGLLSAVCSWRAYWSARIRLRNVQFRRSSRSMSRNCKE